MAVVYDEYAKDRTGYFFGLSGPKLILLVGCGIPAVWALSRQQWGLVLALVAGWVLVAMLVLVPIAGRTTLGWLSASLRHSVGRITGWTTFRARAPTGHAEQLDEVDLPGVLSGITVHEGPPQGVDQRRIVIVQHHPTRTWAVTASITHPGLAMADAADRASQGAGLATLLNACARTELVDEVQFRIRSVPDDGAERDQWMARRHRLDAPTLARQVNEVLAGMLTRAAVRTEAFVTLIVGERRLAREAREYGRGIDGRARALALVMAEAEEHLRAGLRISQLEWLTSPQLACAVRTGFAPATGPASSTHSPRTRPTRRSTRTYRGRWPDPPGPT